VAAISLGIQFNGAGTAKFHSKGGRDDVFQKQLPIGRDTGAARKAQTAAWEEKRPCLNAKVLRGIGCVTNRRTKREPGRAELLLVHFFFVRSEAAEPVVDC
jgi:hypothetical protein